MTGGYEPRWDIDRAYGEEAEAYVRRLLDLEDKAIEVKRKRYVDAIFYVETGQRLRATVDYRPSGINTSEADIWAYVIAETGVVVLIPASRLKAAAREAPTAEERHGSNPTKGRLVSFERLLSADSGQEAAA